MAKATKNKHDKEKKPARKPKATKETDGMSEEEHGQAWQRGEGVETSPNEIEEEESQEESQED